MCVTCVYVSVCKSVVCIDILTLCVCMHVCASHISCVCKDMWLAHVHGDIQNIV